MERIKEYPNYSITEDGKIYSHKTNKFLKPLLKSDGYERIVLYKDGKPKMFYYHQLIGKHLIPNPDNKPNINHKNGIKNDNRLNNLEWCTPSENAKHAFRTGLKTSDSVRGVKHWKNKLNPIDVIAIRKMKKYLTPTKLAKKYDVHVQTIWDIVNRNNWKHI